jgi:acyl-CoA thioester hydrolase
MAKANILLNRTETRIRFSEVDSLGIVWHGNYMKYLEDGREAFGHEFGLGYFDVYKSGLLIPIVKLEVDYKLPVKYGEEIIIETSFIDDAAAKIVFDYTIYRKSDNAVVLSARTVQVFVNESGVLELINPEFYLNWKKSVGLLE